MLACPGHCRLHPSPNPCASTRQPFPGVPIGPNCRWPLAPIDGQALQPIRCQIGTPRNSLGQASRSGSLADSSPSMTSGISAQSKPGCRCHYSTHAV